MHGLPSQRIDTVGKRSVSESSPQERSKHEKWPQVTELARVPHPSEPSLHKLSQQGMESSKKSSDSESTSCEPSLPSSESVGTPRSCSVETTFQPCALDAQKQENCIDKRVPYEAYQSYLDMMRRESEVEGNKFVNGKQTGRDFRSSVESLIHSMVGAVEATLSLVECGELILEEELEAAPTYATKATSTESLNMLEDSEEVTSFRRIASMVEKMELDISAEMGRELLRTIRLSFPYVDISDVDIVLEPANNPDDAAGPSQMTKLSVNCLREVLEEVELQLDDSTFAQAPSIDIGDVKNLFGLIVDKLKKQETIEPMEVTRESDEEKYETKCIVPSKISEEADYSRGSLISRLANKIVLSEGEEESGSNSVQEIVNYSFASVCSYFSSASARPNNSILCFIF